MRKRGAGRRQKDRHCGHLFLILAAHGHDFRLSFCVHLLNRRFKFYRFLMQWCLKVQRSYTFNGGFCFWPLCTVISPETLDVFTISCTVDGERP